VAAHKARLDTREQALQEAILHGPPPLGPGAPAADRLAAVRPRTVVLLSIMAGLGTGPIMANLLHRAAAAIGLRRSHMSGAPDGQAWNPTGWWWCMDHERPENPPDVPGYRRLGPYTSAADAANWRERLDRRNEEWDRDDTDDRR
jgi:hypothetical protein